MATRLDGRRTVVVGDDGSCGTAIRTAIAAAGGTTGALDGAPIDLVVHVAGGSNRARALVDVDEEAWAAAAEMPVRALLATLQAAHPGLRAASGRLVVVVPAVALEGAAGLVAESTGWEAVRLLAKSAARRWAEQGITVNVVATRLSEPPDAARTAPTLDPSHWDDRSVAATVVLVASAEAAHLTGATLQADGGALMLP
jgi:NAD(P)-dependent dehydrogenase (short-subunit alcohol dehydrogenase family)